MRRYGCLVVALLATDLLRFLGLDDTPSWVIVSEHNVDEWPNVGLSSLPDQPDNFSYGFIPPGLFARIKARFLELAHAKKGRAVHR